MAPEIYYTNDEIELTLAAVGLNSFDAFWNIEDTLDESFGIESKRTHKSGKEILRNTCKVDIAGKRYFLKRSCGKSFKSVVYELEARSVLPRFGLTSSGYSACCIDKSSNRAFILLDDLPGYVSYEQIVDKSASGMEMAAFEQEKDSFFSQVIAAFKMIQASPYMYRDWDRNHLFFNPETKAVAMIDLERFMHISQFPLYYRLPMVKKHKRLKERKKLASALGMPLAELETLLK
jgi:hypothetical protein